MALLELLPRAARARGVAAHAGERVNGIVAVRLDAAALGWRRVLEVLRTARCQGVGQHGLGAGCLDRVFGRLRRVRAAAAGGCLAAACGRRVASSVGRVPATRPSATLLTATLLTAGLLTAALTA